MYVVSVVRRNKNKIISNFMEKKIMTNTTVTLSSNGNYWQARYYDTMDRRRTKSLGSKKTLSKRQAKVMCERLAVEIQINPSRAGIGKAYRLGDYLDRYLASRADLRPKTLVQHKLTAKYLLAYFNSEMRIDKITRAAASDWRSSLARGNLTKTTQPAEATVCIQVRNAKVMFNNAVRDDLILFNPFDRLKSNASEPDKDWRYVTRDELRKLFNASPTTSWRLLLALCRLAGLRQGEALGLLWSHIDWDAHSLEVIAEKTGSRRIVPIEPELYSILLEAFETASEGEQMVIPKGTIITSNLWRDFGVICTRAGLKRWKKWCQVLRKNCETDWAQKYPQYAVSIWIGHDMNVSAQYYLQVPKQLYQEVSGLVLHHVDTTCHKESEEIKKVEI
jgi:integrase